MKYSHYKKERSRSRSRDCIFNNKWFIL